MKKILAAVLCIFAVVTTGAFAEEVDLAKEMEAKVFEASNGVELPYRIYVPENTDADKQYSFLLFFHGAGNRGNDNLSQIADNGGLLKRIIGGEKIKYDGGEVNAADEFIIIAPQCAQDSQWVDTPWGKQPDPSYSLADTPKSKYMTAAEELVASVREEYSVNPERMYITGLSMGGFGTWDFIMRHPDMWAAAIPMGGAADVSQAENIVHIPVWTFHQYFDTVVLSEGTQHITEKLVKDGAEIRFTGYFDPQHNAWTKGYAEPDMLEWLYSHTLRTKEEYTPTYRMTNVSGWAQRSTALMLASGFVPESFSGDWRAAADTEEISELLAGTLGDNAPTLDGNKRGELALCLATLFDENAQTAPAFNDLSECDEKTTAAISALTQNGIVSGDGNGSFRPADTLTREEAAALIYRAYMAVNKPAAQN